MTDAELFAFVDVVKGLDTLFPKRLEEHERHQRNKAYFKALKRFPLAQVQAGADAWSIKGKFFPKPAEWIDSVPKARVIAAEIMAMTEAESHEYRRAEALMYEDRPCRCLECRDIDKPLRFVPTLDSDGSEQKRLEGDRVVTAGHWAHGQELAGWYQARADFYDRYLQWVGTKAMA